ncbi:MAG TPA: hypothetical protein VFE47_16155 [Tepidisphaeraceae bacterium]|jgi:hypothetical protein|nr:hypothetical protein [Tepidisphaeraceae bacterium]
MTQHDPRSLPPLPPPVPGQVLPYMTPGVSGTGVVCPKCGCPQFKAVSFTWWGGVLGPKLFSHVKCLNCRAGFNSKTGRSNNTAIGIYIGVSSLIGLVALALFIIAQIH